MADQMNIGPIFIEEGTPSPSSLKFESEPYSNGWWSVKNLNGCELDQKLPRCGMEPFQPG
jgi:hypothetical protein